MIIIYNERHYNIWFHYIRYLKGFKAEYTECHIESLENGIQIITNARKSPNDQFCKKIGRKLAFGRALQQLFPNTPLAREHFWDEYKVKHKI